MELLPFKTSSVFHWLFESTLYITVLICLIFALRSVARRKLPAWWTSGLWLLLVLRMLLPWGFESRLSIYNLIPETTENNSYVPLLREHVLHIPILQNDAGISASTAERPTNEPVGEAVAGNESKASHLNMTYDDALLFLWFAGVLIFLTIILIKNIRFRMSVGRGSQVSDTGVLNLLEECRTVMAIRKQPPVVVTDGVKSPALLGYFRPRLLLPPNLISLLEKEELRCVFLHELGHLKRHDIAVSWLVAVLQAVYWFNPLVWFAFHYLRIDQEAACDAYVISRTKNILTADYAHAIIRLLERFCQNRQMPALTGIIENKSQVGKRIAMIMNFRVNTLKMTLVSVFMFIAAGFVLFVSSNGLANEKKTTKDMIPAYGLSIERATNGSDIVSDSQLPEERITGGAGMIQDAELPGQPQTEGSAIIQIAADVKHNENTKPYGDTKSYSSSEWKFALDIPKDWNSYPPHAGSELMATRFSSRENGNDDLTIYLIPNDPQKSLEEVLNQIKGFYQGQFDFGNSSNVETAMGSRKAIMFDFKLQIGGGARKFRAYLTAEGTLGYILLFDTTDKDDVLDLYGRIAKSFHILEKPVAADVKHFKTIDGNLSLDIPGRWNAFPYATSAEHPALALLGSNQDGIIRAFLIYRFPYDPKQSLEAARDQRRQHLPSEGYGNFVNGETTVGSRKALILECNRNAQSMRQYFITDGRFTYVLSFWTDNEAGITGGELELSDRIAKGFKILSAPDSP